MPFDREAVRGAGSSIGGLLRMILMTPLRVLSWSWRQLVGTWRGLSEIVRGFSLDRILPSGVRGFILEVLRLLKFAAGAGSKSRGVYSGITLILVGILTSWSLIGIPLIALGLLLVLVNSARAVPWIGEAWRGSRAQREVRKDRDIPVWRNE